MKPKRKKLPKHKTVDARPTKKDHLGDVGDDDSELSNLLGMSQQEMSMNGPEETPRGSQGSGQKRGSSRQILEDDSEVEEVVVESKKKHINKSTFKPNNNDDIENIKPPKRPKRQKNYDIQVDRPKTITEESSEVTSPEIVSPTSPISPIKMQAKF